VVFFSKMGFFADFLKKGAAKQAQRLVLVLLVDEPKKTAALTH
jgi:hypothetical protein